MLNINKKRDLKYKKEKGNKLIGVGFVVVIVAISVFVLWSATTGRPDVTGGIDLPNYALRTTEVTQGYVAAVELPSLFEYIPCYCGCGGIGHMYLRDCFYNEVGEFDQHASGCNTCINEALTIWNMNKQGASLLQIRNTIDAQYTALGYSPTNTPMPPS